MKKDARYLRSEAAVKEAFLILLKQERLEDITMTRLARAANISRSTLYSHYGNLEEIYRFLVLEFAKNLRELGAHLHCCNYTDDTLGIPFCLAVREAGVWEPLVHSEKFLDTLFDAILQQGGYLPSLEAYRKLVHDEHLARALLRFQLSGCYKAACFNDPALQWSVVQHKLDTFIRGGFAALRQESS